MQTAAHRQEEARLATLRALEDSCVAGDLAAVRAVVSAMDPSAATALVNHAASGRNTLLFKVGHGVFEPPIGQGLICSQETEYIAMLYDVCRF